MESYNVFKLFVVKSNNIYCISKKENDKYIDIFLDEEIEVDYRDDIKYLASYYMVETMEKLARGEEFYLTKKDLLLKFAELNSRDLYKNNLESYPDNFISYQEKYLNAFKELSEKRPEIAKMISEEKIKKLNLKFDK